MLRDPIVEEVRQVRHTIEAECGDDAQKYYDYIRQMQVKYRDRLVQLKPKPTLKKQMSAV